MKLGTHAAPIIPALGRLGQGCKFQTSLGYTA